MTRASMTMRSIGGIAATVMLTATVTAQELPTRGVPRLAVDVDTRPRAQLDTDVVVVAAFDGQEPGAAIAGGAPALQAAIGAATAQRALQGSLAHVSLFAPPGLATRRLMIVNAGAQAGWDVERLRQLAGASVRSLRAQQVQSIGFWVPGGLPPAEAAAAVSEGVLLAAFDPGVHKSGATPSPLTTVRIAGLKESGPAVTQAVNRGLVLAESQNIARSLIVEPSNYMTPEMMAQHARQIAQETGLEVEVFDERTIESMGMGGVRAVGQGAAFPPRFIVLRYRASSPSATTLALAGKGVTFDSGGISLKDSLNMYRMKGDMAGGAAVLGAMRAIARLRPAINVIGIVPAVMNLPSGTAQRPGDVFTALDGTTVEVMSTDAEGRMILADAVAYAVKEGATHIVDVATLTGSVVTALGDRHVGAFSSDDGFYQMLQGAATRSGESFWRLPIDEEYAAGIRASLVADLNETGGAAGASVGAKFIQHFTAGRPWIHLDIAGTSWPATQPPHMSAGPTGVTVRTLAELAVSMASGR
jgi:leucyl aminopeptidase